MMKILRFGLLFLLFACIAPAANATAQYRHPATGLTFPDSVEDIVRGDVTDF